jgi:hypothetical protein
MRTQRVNSGRPPQFGQRSRAARQNNMINLFPGDSMPQYSDEMFLR